MTQTNIVVKRKELVAASRYLIFQLKDKYLYKPLTASTIEHIKADIYYVLQDMRRRETNPVWQINYEVEVSGVSSFELRPNLEGVTVLDEPPSSPRSW